MRLITVILLLAAGTFPVFGADPMPKPRETARILKVLPHYLDEKGRHTLSPSLFERDAYQALLRKEPDRVSTLRFDVQWSALGARQQDWELQLEARGARSHQVAPLVRSVPVRPDRWGSSWTTIQLTRAEYESLEEVIAWRLTLKSSGRQVTERRSFLW